MGLCRPNGTSFKCDRIFPQLKLWAKIFRPSGTLVRVPPRV